MACRMRDQCIDLDYPLGISPARAQEKGTLPCLDVFVAMKKQHPLRVVFLRVSRCHGRSSAAGARPRNLFCTIDHFHIHAPCAS
jgi:hypothetical protein